MTAHAEGAARTRRSRGAWGALAAALLLRAFPARAIDPNAGTSAGTFLKLGTGNPRALALGRAYVALAEGVDALTWNPAGIATAEQRTIAYSKQSWFQDYGGNYFGYVQPVGRTVWGANFAYMSVTGFDARDENGIPLDGSNIIVRDSFATIAVARSFFLEKFNIGAAVRGVREDNAGTSYQNIVGDVGVLFKPNPRFSLGGALQNFFGNKASVVQTERVGAAFSPNSFFTFSGEVSKDSDNSARPGLGIEFTLPQEVLEVGSFSLRVGFFNQDNPGQSFDESLKKLGLDHASGVSFGCGLYSSHILGYGLGLDYSFVPYGALGSANQISLKLSF